MKLAAAVIAAATCLLLGWALGYRVTREAWEPVTDEEEALPRAALSSAWREWAEVDGV